MFFESTENKQMKQEASSFANYCGDLHQRGRSCRDESHLRDNDPKMVKERAKVEKAAHKDYMAGNVPRDWQAQVGNGYTPKDYSKPRPAQPESAGDRGDAAKTKDSLATQALFNRRAKDGL